MLKQAAVWMTLALLASCGGGGGGGSDANVTFTPSALTATAFQQQQANVSAFQDATVTVTAAASGNLSGTVFAVVQDTGLGFANSPIQVVHTGNGYSATLKPNVSLAPGTYTGTLVLHLCKDSRCAQEYSVAGASLPYEVTILPRLQVTVSVNGVAVGTVQSAPGSLALNMADGDTLQVQSNTPVTLMYSSGPGFVTATVDPASTATTWRATLARPAFPSTNQIDLSAVPQGPTRGIQMSANLRVTMVP